MKAVVLEKKDEISVRQVPEAAAPGPGELLIAPHTVGICGSDVHYYTHGRIGPFVLESPMILGHEGAGTVIGLGPGVQGFLVGDRVAMEPGIPDPASRASRMGMYNVDPSVRFWATPPVDGCLVERVVHPASFTYHLPDSLSFGEGALVEPLAVGMHAATKAGIRPGDVAVVAGCGTVGLLTAAAVLAGGASMVLVSDVSGTKLDIAAGIPGVVPVDLRSEDLHEVGMTDTGGWGADLVFEASGSAKSYESLWTLGAPGNRTVLIGMPTGPVVMDVVEMQARETTIHTIFRYANVYQRAIDLMVAGKIDVSPYITETFAMDDALAAFERVAEGRPEDVKIQILVDQS